MHALLVGTDPPLVVSGEDETCLRDQIRATALRALLGLRRADRGCPTRFAPNGLYRSWLDSHVADGLRTSRSCSRSATSAADRSYAMSAVTTATR